MIKKLTTFFVPLILPVLFANYPAILHYADNVSILEISSLGRMIIFNSALALVLYALYFFSARKKPFSAAIATFVFLIFYNTYGFFYNHLLAMDIFIVEHYNFFPLYLLIAIYTTIFVIRIDLEVAKKIWSIITMLVLILVIYNVVRFLPKEISRIRNEKNAIQEEEIIPSQSSESYPDIYYLVFDEFSGFEAMRDYWQYEEIDEFSNFLKSKGFYVAESSHASSVDTLHQMASRLNYREYPLGAEYVDTYFQDIADNQVMRYLKGIGYTTIVFDETRVSFAYPAKAPVKSDINYEDDPSAEKKSGGFLFDEYGTLVADKTMLLTISKYYKIYNPELQKHENMIYFTLNKLGEINQKDPIFVYSHLVLPHMPFMFDERGNFVDPSYHQNWDYYLGTYKFAVDVAERMVDNILAQYDPDDLPIIILQSDHGARNKPTSNPESKILENFPEEYRTLIMNAIYLPNCENAPLSQDMDPVDTFPIIFNCAFGDNIPLK